MRDEVFHAQPRPRFTRHMGHTGLRQFHDWGFHGHLPFIWPNGFFHGHLLKRPQATKSKAKPTLRWDVCIPGDLSFTFQDKLEIGWHQLLKARRPPPAKPLGPANPQARDNPAVAAPEPGPSLKKISGFSCLLPPSFAKQSTSKAWAAQVLFDPALQTSRSQVEILRQL